MLTLGNQFDLGRGGEGKLLEMYEILESVGAVAGEAGRAGSLAPGAAAGS